jgi:apolipoprotein N-acyltransferase
MPQPLADATSGWCDRATALWQQLIAAPRWWQALLVGAMLTLGFAPFFMWPLGVLSLVVVWHWLGQLWGWRRWAGTTLLWGMGHQLTALYWLPRAFYADAGNDWMAGLAGGLPALLGLALFGSVGLLLALSLARLTKHWLPVWAVGGVAVVMWLGLEWLKTLHPIGFPWLPLGAMGAGSLPLLQLAAWGEVFAISALFLLLGWLFSLLQRGAHYAALALLVLAYGAGSWRLANAPSIEELQSNQKLIRLVQPNIQSPHKWDTARREAILHQTMQIGFASVAPNQPTPALVIFPETAVAFYLNEQPDVLDAVGAYLRPEQALLTGTVRRNLAASPTQYFNTAAVVASVPTGTDMAVTGLISYMDKQLLVPFGEYLPWRSWWEPWLPFTLRTVSQNRLDYSFGTAPPTLPTPAGPMLTLICYEGIFPGYVHAQRARNRQLTALVNITNDNWFTGTTALFQHAALARLRAVATGLPLVRAANTGLTVVWDGYGREVGRLPINRAARLDVRLPRSVNSL